MVRGDMEAGRGGMGVAGGGHHILLHLKVRCKIAGVVPDTSGKETSEIRRRMRGAVASAAGVGDDATSTAVSENVSDESFWREAAGREEGGGGEERWKEGCCSGWRRVRMTSERVSVTCV